MCFFLKLLGMTRQPSINIILSDTDSCFVTSQNGLMVFGRSFFHFGEPHSKGLCEELIGGVFFAIVL